jgi:hypothetical protein
MSSLKYKVGDKLQSKREGYWLDRIYTIVGKQEFTFELREGNLPDKILWSKNDLDYLKVVHLNKKKAYLPDWL